MVLDNVSVPIKEWKFCGPLLTKFLGSLFVKFNGQKIVSVDPLYVWSKKRLCFCVKEYKCKEECLCMSNHQTKDDSICECLTECRITTYDLELTLYIGRKGIGDMVEDSFYGYNSESIRLSVRTPSYIYAPSDYLEDSNQSKDTVHFTEEDPSYGHSSESNQSTDHTPSYISTFSEYSKDSDFHWEDTDIEN